MQPCLRNKSLARTVQGFVVRNTILFGISFYGARRALCRLIAEILIFGSEDGNYDKINITIIYSFIWTLFINLRFYLSYLAYNNWALPTLTISFLVLLFVVFSQIYSHLITVRSP